LPGIFRSRAKAIPQKLSDHSRAASEGARPGRSHFGSFFPNTALESGGLLSSLTAATGLIPFFRWLGTNRCPVN